MTYTPLFASFVGQDSMLNSKNKIDTYYTVQVKFDNNETKLYRFFIIEQTIQEIPLESLESFESLEGERSKFNDWQTALIKVWERESRKSSYDAKKIVYKCSFNENKGFNWLATKPNNPTHFFPPKLTSNSSWLSDTWTEITTSTYNFFKPAVEPELYKFSNDPFNPTSFKPGQIAKIVNRINELQREKVSVWSFNKELKTAKIEGLINLIEQSKDSSAFESVMQALRNPNLVAGIISTRTFDLLMELKKECSENNVSNTDTKSLYSTAI